MTQEAPLHLHGLSPDDSFHREPKSLRGYSSYNLKMTWNLGHLSKYSDALREGS